MRIGLIIGCLLVLGACGPAKKVQKIQTAISKVDTTPVVRVSKGVDSASQFLAVYNKVLKNKIDFQTFNAKLRVEYDGKEGGDEATAFVRLVKDSLLWLSVRGPLGVEGLRVIVSQDSVKVLDPIHKNVKLRSIEYLQEMTQLPFDFATLQNLVVGNPVFIDSNVVSFKENGNNELLVLMIGKLFKHLVTLDKNDFTLLHSKLDDVDEVRNRTCDITFSDYQSQAGFPFSTKRKISVAERSKLDISLDFKQYTFNQPVTFPFSIPKNYKRQ